MEIEEHNAFADNLQPSEYDSLDDWASDQSDLDDILERPIKFAK